MSDETTPVHGMQFPVVVHNQPFASTVALMQGLHGQSLSQLVTACKLPPAVMPYVRVWINDVEIAPDDWASTVPAVGSSVYIRVVPQKSGKDIFRAIAMIVITVVAFYVAPVIAGTGAAGASMAGMTLGAQLGTALVAASITAVGMLALNALVPPPGLKNNRQDEKDRLTGSSNAFAPYGNIPRVFGKRRVYPMLAARPYSEIQGDDEYLRMALVVGWGPLEISNIRIGETPITAYEGVQYEVREGWSTDLPLTLFTKTVTEDSFTIRLEPYQTTGYYPGGYGYYGDYYRYDGDLGTYDPVDPGTVSTTNDYGYRTTATNAVEFSVDVTFPQGLFRFDDKGNQKEATVAFSVQYAPVGSSNWVNAVWANSADTGFGTAGQITVKGSSSTAIRRSGRVVLPSAGQYQVRVRRTTANGGSKYVDLAWWTALRTIKADYPVNQKNVSLIALRIKASNQLNGVPQTINCDAESYLPVYSGGTWTFTKTSNPAWAFADILRRRGGETYIADSRIDLTAISNWATACATTAPNASEPRWTFNGVLEGGSIIEALKTIAGNARALYTMRDGKHSVVRDIQQTVPIQHITPRNSSGYSGSKVFLEYPHALRVLFINKDNGYQTDERVVYDDGYTAANATKFETLELVGCTSATQAYREARYHMAVAKLRPEQHTVQMDIEALRCTLGDLVMFSHDAIGIGIMATRVKSITTSAGNVTTVTLDDDVYFETGTSYVVRTRKSDGTTKLQAVNNPGTGYASVLTITTPTTAANSPAVGDLVMFGTSASVTAPMLVRKIEPAEDFNVTVTLVDAQDGVYTADTGVIPAFNSYLTTSSAPGSGEVPAVYISTVRSDDSVVVVNADGSLNYRIFVGVQQPESTQQERIDRFEVQYRIKNTEFWEVLSLERANPFGYIDRVVVGDIYQLRSRGIAASGATGTWSATVEHTVVGKTNFSGVATSVSATAIPGGIRLAWANPTNTDLWETEIYENTVNNSATATLFATVTASTYDRLGLESANGTRYYWLKSVDTSGNKGAFSTGVSATALNRVLALNLTNEAVSLSADSAGTVASFATAVGTLTVFDGNTDVTASATLSSVATSCTGAVNTAANTPTNGQPKGYYAVTAASADNAKLAITATYNGQSITKEFTVAKARAGTNGTNGTNGVNAVEVTLSNAATTVFAYADGSVPSFSGVDGQLIVYSGSTDVTASATLSATASGLTGTINTAANTPVNGQPKGYYRVTAMSADTGTLTLSAVYGGVTYTRIFSVSKVKTGYEIVAALPSTNLFAGRMVFLTTDNKLYRYTGSAWTSAVPSTDISGTISDAQIAGLAAAKVTGQLSNTQIADLAATKITGQLSNAQIADLAATKISGTLSDAQLAAISAAKVTGQLSDSQLQAISATKVSGQLTNAQLASIDAAKVAGQLADSQIASVSLIKVSGQAGGGNLLNNSNFKNVSGSVNVDGSMPVGWGVYNNGGVSTTTRVVSGGLFGTNYYRVTANVATSNTLGMYTNVGSSMWTPGVTYTVSFWARAGSANIAGLYMEGLYSNMGFSSATNTANPPLSTSAWQRYVWRVTPNNNGSTPSGELYISWSVGGGGYGTFPAGGVLEICAPQVQQGELVSAYAPRPDEILPGTITSTEISDGAITTPKIVTGAVTANTIAANAISADKIAANAVTAEKISANAITSDKISANAITSAKIEAGAITTGLLAADAVTADKIAANAVTASEISAGAVTAGKIAAGAVTAAEIAAGAITAEKVSAGAITTASLAADAVTADKIAANAVTASEISAGAVTAGKIAANAVTANEIAANAITAAKIDAGAVTTAKLAAGAVTANEIAANAITSAKIDAGAVTTAKLTAGAVTANEIAAGAVIAGKIAANAVTATEIAADAITSNKIAAGAITAAKLAATSVITASAQIGDGVITNAKIDNLNVNKLTGDITTYVTGQGSSNGAYVPTTETTYLTVQLPAATHPNGHKPYVQLNVLSGTTLSSNFFINLYSAPVGTGASTANITVYPSIEEYWFWYEPEIQYYEQIGWKLTFYNAVDIEVGDTLTSGMAEVGYVDSVYMNGTQQIVYVSAWQASLSGPYVRSRPSLGNGVVGTYTQVRGITVVNQSQRSTSIFVPELTTTLGRSYQVRCRAGTASRVIITSIDILAMGIR